VHAVVIAGSGRAFCSGGDVRDIIGRLIDMPHGEVLAFTRMTGELIGNLRRLEKPVVAAVHGLAAGAGAVIAAAADLRVFGSEAGSPSSSPRSASPARTWAPPTCCRA